MGQTEHSRPDALVCWTVVARAPRVLGPARRMRHVLLEPAAGHAELGGGGNVSACGPRESAAGQACGPRPPARWGTARRRISDLVERARRFAKLLRDEPGLTQGAFGEREGVSGPRVNQVLSMLRLHEAILADVTDPERDTPVPSLDELFVIGRIADPRQQVARYRAIRASLDGRRGGAKAAAARQRGFQHLFAQARAYQAALDAGEFRSLAALAKAEGVSRHWVGQVLDLLTLVPEIQVALDVPAEQLPAGLTQKDVRRLARIEDDEAQRAWLRRRWPALAP